MEGGLRHKLAKKCPKTGNEDDETAMTLVMKMMAATSLRLSRCSLVTSGEEARKETIGGT